MVEQACPIGVYCLGVNIHDCAISILLTCSMDMVLDSKLLANKEVSEFKCSGSEGSLSECKHSTTSTYCNSEYAGVICATEPSGKWLYCPEEMLIISLLLYISNVSTQNPAQALST